MLKAASNLLITCLGLLLFSCSNEQAVDKNEQTAPLPPPATKVVINYSFEGVKKPVLVKLYRYSNNDWFFVDSSSNQTFVLREPQQGVYSIDTTHVDEIVQDLLTFPIGPADTLINIQLSDKQQKVESLEYEAYEQLMRRTFVKQMSIDSMEVAVSKVSKINPKYYTTKEDMRIRINEKIGEYNGHLRDIAKEYPNTYTAQVLVPTLIHTTRVDSKELSEKFDNDHAYNHIHYFDKADFSDSRIMNHPIFFYEIEVYPERYMGEFEEDFKASIDMMMKKTGDNEENKIALGHYLVNYFDDRAMRNFSEYILEHYLNLCSDDATLDGRKLKDHQLEDRILEATYMGSDGSNKLLRDTYAQNDLTIVLLWKTTCPHCMREMPEIKMLHDQYSEKGLEVFAISLDDEKANWLSFSKLTPLPWVNTYSAARGEEEIKVPYTPYIFVVNKNGAVVARHLKGSILKEFLISRYNKNL